MSKYDPDEQMEREANYFAICLLMPEDLLRQELEKVKKKEVSEVVELLADKFKVSQAHMAIRLGQIGVLTG